MWLVKYCSIWPDPSIPCFFPHSDSNIVSKTWDPGIQDFICPPKRAQGLAQRPGFEAMDLELPLPQEDGPPQREDDEVIMMSSHG